MPDTDADGEGSPHCVDCDDGDGSVSPGAEELCNAVDDNCDGIIAEGCECGPYVIPCDLDADCDVDIGDVMITLSHRNQPGSAHPACDLDGYGMITGARCQVVRPRLYMCQVCVQLTHVTLDSMWASPGRLPWLH